MGWHVFALLNNGELYYVEFVPFDEYDKLEAVYGIKTHD